MKSCFLRRFALACLLFCSPAVLSADEGGELRQTEVFVSGRDGYHTYRIPSVIVTPKGTVLAFCEARKESRSDTGNIDLVLRRSLDGGATWEPMQVVADEGPNTIGNPCPVIDQSTGTIWLPLTRNLGQDTEAEIINGTSEGTRECWLMHSTDDGKTWSKPIDITRAVKRPEWTWYATGPGVGIQLASGRLVIPCDSKTAGRKQWLSHVIYSDDHGKSWQLGGVVEENVNECQVVELEDGDLMINMRSYHGKNRRAVATSKDGGLTWTAPVLDEALIEPVCQASFLRYTRRADFGRSRLLFSNPAESRREKMTIRVSYDEGQTWPVARLLHAGPAAYSCLTVLPDMTIGCLYERGEKSAYETITFARFPIEWVTDGKDRLNRGKGK